MASLRRSKTLSPDGQTARFLYTILKQLDLKTIDWNEVAGSLDITNGHAARMRFSRFKQHIEGIPTQPRTPRMKKNEDKIGRGKGKKGTKRAVDEEIKEEQIKGEIKEEALGNKRQPFQINSEGGATKIKQEPDLIRYDRSENGEPPMVKIKREPALENNMLMSMAMSDRPNQTTDVPRSSSAHPLSGSGLFATSITNNMNGNQPPPRPPHATVALADIQLPPKSISSASSFTPQHYTLQTAPTSSNDYRDTSVTRIKMEPEDVEKSLENMNQVVTKLEPNDF